MNKSLYLIIINSITLNLYNEVNLSFFSLVSVNLENITNNKKVILTFS